MKRVAIAVAGSALLATFVVWRGCVAAPAGLPTARDAATLHRTPARPSRSAGAARVSAPKAARSNVDEERASPSPAPVRRRLRGKFVGFDSSLPATATLAITGVPRNPALTVSFESVDVGADSEFDVDVEPLFAGGLDVATIEVVASHPDFVRAHARVELPEPAASEGEWSVEIAWTRAAVLTGRVIDETGQPFASAFVQLREALGSRVRRREAGSAKTDADGRFALRAPASGTWWVTAVSIGKRPTGVIVFAKTGEHSDVPDLVLEDGAVISGRVRFSDGSPAVCPSVEARRVDAGDPEILTADVGVAGGLVVSLGASARADSDGRFELTGLDPGRYRLRVTQLANRSDRLLADAVETIAAPASDVDFVLADHSRIVVETHVHGEPVGDVRLWIGSKEDERFGMTDANGRAVFDSMPGDAYEVWANRPGFESASATIERVAAAQDRRAVIELVRVRHPSTLTLTLLDPDEQSLSSAYVGVERLGSTIDRWMLRPDDDGKFVARELMPGRHRITAAAFAPTELVIAPLDLELSADEERSVVLHAQRGSRLHAEARDDAGDPVKASWRVLALDGDPVRLESRSNLRNGYEYVAVIGEPSRTADALVLPGTYTIECSADGFAPRTTTAVVVAGEATRVEVVLHEE
jgi:carboxypeptidase family protein